jgi:hypothetical protein
MTTRLHCAQVYIRVHKRKVQKMTLKVFIHYHGRPFIQESKIKTNPHIIFVG